MYVVQDEYLTSYSILKLQGSKVVFHFRGSLNSKFASWGCLELKFSTKSSISFSKDSLWGVISSLPVPELAVVHCAALVSAIPMVTDAGVLWKRGTVWDNATFLALYFMFRSLGNLCLAKDDKTLNFASSSILLESLGKGLRCASAETIIWAREGSVTPWKPSWQQ